MAFIRLYPATDVNSVAAEIDRAFNRFFGVAGNGKSEAETEIAAWRPRVDIRESKDDFVLTVELPGISKEDIHIHYEDDTLRVEGERKREVPGDGAEYLRGERVYGKFSREFKVNTPVQSDKIEAEFKNGLLSIRLPKAEEAKPKQIKINAGK
ncbi:MAG: Hsp20/alpha crystallin family protein [Calditrichaceae bacterium]|nr:Hsp20/alpha crystallin family protein [Calditrichia bacterium]NUQ39956.1 Hsp20/alpha crystallin family protein [Calditrichaceae bacterium]